MYQLVVGILDTPEFLAMNPYGKILVICGDTAVIWESQTILRYISAKYGKPQFWSDDPYVRAQDYVPIHHAVRGKSKSLIQTLGLDPLQSINAG